MKTCLRCPSEVSDIGDYILCGDCTRRAYSNHPIRNKECYMIQDCIYKRSMSKNREWLPSGCIDYKVATNGNLFLYQFCPECCYRLKYKMHIDKYSKMFSPQRGVSKHTYERVRDELLKKKDQLRELEKVQETLQEKLRDKDLQIAIMEKTQDAILNKRFSIDTRHQETSNYHPKTNYQETLIEDTKPMNNPYMISSERTYPRNHADKYTDTIGTFSTSGNKRLRDAEETNPPAKRQRIINMDTPKMEVMVKEFISSIKQK